MTGTFSLATSNSENHALSDEQLFNKLVETNATVLYDKNKKIEKLPIDNNYVDIEGVAEYNTDELENIDIYMIKSLDSSENSNSKVTIITDMEVKTPIIDTSEITPLSSGGTKYRTKKCGRVTVYMECWYTKKSFNGSNGVKLTKTGGQITDKENSSLVIRKLKSTYTGRGSCWNSSGKVLSVNPYKRSKTHSASSYSTFQSWNTSSIDRYYYTGGSGLLQARFYVTYGGTTASSQSEYSVSINLASF